MTEPRPGPVHLPAQWRLQRRSGPQLLALAVAAGLPSALLAALVAAERAAPLVIAGALVGTAVAGAFATMAISLWRGRGGPAGGSVLNARAMERTGALMKGRLEEIERAAARLERSVAAATDLLEAERGVLPPAQEGRVRRAGEACPCAPPAAEGTPRPAEPAVAVRRPPGPRAGPVLVPRRAPARSGAAPFEKEIARYLSVSRKV